MREYSYASAPMPPARASRRMPTIHSSAWCLRFARGCAAGEGVWFRCGRGVLWLLRGERCPDGALCPEGVDDFPDVARADPARAGVAWADDVRADVDRADVDRDDADRADRADRDDADRADAPDEALRVRRGAELSSSAPRAGRDARRSAGVRCVCGSSAMHPTIFRASCFRQCPRLARPPRRGTVSSGLLHICRKCSSSPFGSKLRYGMFITHLAREFL